MTVETPPPLPFDASPGKVVAIVHAHDDDESVFTGEAIRCLAAGEAVVRGITATNGEAGGKGAREIVRSGQRALEGQAAYASLGVPASEQERLGLPDGQLHRRLQQARLTARLGRAMVRHNIAIAITPDSGGIDAHRDHQAVSRATIWAARGVQLLGKRVAVWTLSSTGQGEVVLPVDPASKLRAIAAHTSQFSLSHLDTSKLERGFDRSLIPADLAQYGELLDGQETYDRVRLWESLGQQLLGRLRLPKKTTSDTTTDALY